MSEVDKGCWFYIFLMLCVKRISWPRRNSYCLLHVLFTIMFIFKGLTICRGSYSKMVDLLLLNMK